jgi:hypothetical protein
MIPSGATVSLMDYCRFRPAQNASVVKRATKVSVDPVASKEVTASTCTTAIETITTTIVAQALNSMDRDLASMSAAKA